MPAQIIDGKMQAKHLRERIKSDVARLESLINRRPGLAVVLVGTDPASEIYVRSKIKQAAETGVISIERMLPESTTQDQLLSIIDELNADRTVDGILVQLPLPDHIAADVVIQKIRPDKDVDGFHPLNAGRLASGLPALVPCTPAGCCHLVRSVRSDIAGARAVVVGRSNIVGKPVAQLLLAANATVTIAHSRTGNLRELCREADILVAAVGRPELVRGDWIRPGAIVIDVGINRVDGPNRKIVGDVAYQEAAEVAGWITPVPGGVGPMTIACLLENTLAAAGASSGLREPHLAID